MGTINNRPLTSTAAKQLLRQNTEPVLGDESDGAQNRCTQTQEILESTLLCLGGDVHMVDIINHY